MGLVPQGLSRERKNEIARQTEPGLMAETNANVVNQPAKYRTHSACVNIDHVLCVCANV